MNHHRNMPVACLIGVLAGMAWTPAAPAESDVLRDNDVLMRALVDELQRSMTLRMEDLERPYFIHYGVDDTIVYQLSASYGSVISSDRDRSRDFYSTIRVGSYELDNTNFVAGRRRFFGGRRGGGGRAALPIDDDYLALRHAMWLASDGDYKEAVETLTKKRAYLRDKNIQDRPDDFSKADSVEVIEPSAELSFDRSAWEAKLKQISGRFKQYEQIQDSMVWLFAAAGNSYVVNSEGFRLRTADDGALLIMTAEGQCGDGMRISHHKTYTGNTTADLPAVDDMLVGVDEMVGQLGRAMQAPVLQQYTGPVLFDGIAACQMFKELLAEGLAGKVDPVGQQRMFEGGEDLDNKLDRRILPKSFQVVDDPTIRESGGEVLLGHYRYDDEGMAARRVQLVADGVLKSMVMSRVPTKKLSGSNGHGRRSAGGALQSSIGCLFIRDDAGVPSEELKQQLIEAAEDEGLEYGLRVSSIRTTGLGMSQTDMVSMFMSRQQGEPSLGDPIFAYKVYVKDGREELIRGCEFGTFRVRDLRKIAAAGDRLTVYNYVDIGRGGGAPPASIIAPAVLFEEVELSKIEQEHDKLPILKPPTSR